MKTKDVKLNFFKSVGNFFFFSSTEVQSKHVRPLAANEQGLAKVWNLEIVSPEPQLNLITNV